MEVNMEKIKKSLDSIVAEVLLVSKPFIVVLVVVMICKVITFVVGV